MSKAKAEKIFRPNDQRRAEIIAATFNCLQESGYASLTARKIAERAGISLGHLTYHFENMQEILVETYRHASTLLYEATQQNLSSLRQSPMQRLKIFLDTGFANEFTTRDYIRVRVDLWSAAQAYEEIAEVERQLYDRYRRNLVVLIEDAVREAALPRDRIAMLADTIMATLDGLWLDWQRRGDTVAIKNGLHGCMALVEAAIEPVPARVKTSRRKKPVQA